ncbi:MAG: hypothetical protein WCY11_21165 [Novosphingobium sp.]
MGLFKADFYRSFAIGFALGAVAVFGVVSGSVNNPLVSAAIAQPADQG